jgi:hypothetical protein
VCAAGTTAAAGISVAAGRCKWQVAAVGTIWASKLLLQIQLLLKVQQQMLWQLVLLQVQVLLQVLLLHAQVAGAGICLRS